ncbi:hypothetical protein DPSP01_005973 [Paraphaeosphaeria sporulosa]|uniref:Uncharacterized protein n=1 Tax=Paraphaeosphaeria sporulosa TaxID=1460663 RepID=A0A177CBL6_9PLEO|nr:uncharacterized protein CC84DRAFT_1178049 [Paraphaeosphaeria sporulosa]OAG04167.1 hypothetical protein CC84DRAFT_1178049 [Paraphaeosphaeria sporulosa]
MSAMLLLPAPVASNSFKIGQLLADPLHPDVDSFHNENDMLSLRAPTVQTHFREMLECDDAGQFIGRHSHTSTSNERSVLIEAEKMSHTTLRDPLSAFRYVSRRASSQAYLHQAALHRKPLYYVTAIQTLSNYHYMDDDPNIAIAKKPQVRRHDSGISLNEQDGNVILAVELTKVYCRIGSPDEPQRPSDIGYAYKYYPLQGEEQRQLAVGFGPAVDYQEFRNLVGISSDSDYTDASADSDSFDEDEDEGCMCCSSSISNASYRRY